jgi:hypothetical protein
VDRGYADRLVSSLLLNAVQVWYDQRDLNVGENVHESIHAGLLEVDFLAVVLTPRSVESAWVKEELSLAKQRELEERHIIVLPLLFEKAALPLHLRARKYADFTDFESGFRQLMKAINRSATVNSLDDSLRLRVRDAISALGSGTANGIQAIRSQNMARLVRGTALTSDQVAKQLNSDSGVDGLRPATVFIDIQSAGIEIPIQVDLSERCGSVLARVLQAVGLDDLVVREQRFSFFLVHQGIPFELDEKLSDAGVNDGAHLQLGAFTFLIE